MKKLAAYVGALLLVVGGAVAAFWPINFWRLYDANLRPLALTHAENYCAGFHGFAAGFPEHDPAVTDCEQGGSYDNETPSVAESVRWACQGIVAGGWGATVAECEDIFERDQLWLVKGGGITYSWNDAWPRPRPLGGSIAPMDDSRTGSRAGFSRDDTTRQGEQ